MDKSRTLVSLFILASWTNSAAPSVYCPKDSQAVWGWLTRPICGSLSGRFCFLGPSLLVGNKNFEFVSIGNIPDTFQYATSNIDSIFKYWFQCFHSFWNISDWNGQCVRDSWQRVLPVFAGVLDWNRFLFVFLKKLNFTLFSTVPAIVPCSAWFEVTSLQG